jgi:predicted porin
MNHKLLPLALVAVSLYTSHSFADDTDITFYGKANVSLHQNDFETAATGTVVQDEDNWTLNSNASRLGVKGSVPINDNLKAIYKAEYEIFVDGGDDEFSQRNIYGGLQGPWGTVIAGKNDTPLKLIASQGKVDRFNDLDRGDIKYVMVGENRASNIVVYGSPKFSGFSVSAAFMPGEDSEGGDDDGLADQISLALTYTYEDLYLAFAIDDNVEHTDIVRLVGSYTFGDVKLGGLYQMADGSDSSDEVGKLKGPLSKLDSGFDFDEQDAYLISGEWKLNKHVVLKAQLAMSESTPSTANLDDADTTQIAFGADYKLSKATKVFVYFSQIETEADSMLANGDVTDSTFGTGLQIKF